MTGKDGKVVHDKERLRLLEAWKLGHSLLATSFNNAIADTITSKMQEDDVYPTWLQAVLYEISG